MHGATILQPGIAAVERTGAQTELAAVEVGGSLGQSQPAAMMQLPQTRRALIWAILALIVALLCFVGFRGYLSSEMLFNFANMFYC